MSTTHDPKGIGIFLAPKMVNYIIGDSCISRYWTGYFILWEQKIHFFGGMDIVIDE